jgi:hypothetical protein
MVLFIVRMTLAKGLFMGDLNRVDRINRIGNFLQGWSG